MRFSFRPAVAFASLALLAVAAPAAASPSPGSVGIGDRLNPTLGNGGYDVLHYDLDLRYATSNPAQSLLGDETIAARATQSLSRFNLDFGGNGITGIRVNGRSARFSHEGEELVVTPRHPLRKGRTFVVKVAGFTATPTTPGDTDASTAFFITPDGSATAPQPLLRAPGLPLQRPPARQGHLPLRFNVPEGTKAVANGVETGRRTRHGRTKWTYVMRQPMATELTQIAVGNWDFSTPQRHHGVILRDVTAPSVTGGPPAGASIEPGQLDYMEARVGRYPFDIFGSLIVIADLGFALETQTISLLDTTWFDSPQAVWDPTMLHELSHMWFGDSVSPVRVERPLAQRGPRQLVRVPLRRREGLPHRGHDQLPGRAGLRHARRADARRLRPQRPVATRLRPGRQAEQRRRRPVQLQRLPRRCARPVRAAPEDRQRRVRPGRAGLGGALSRQVAGTDDFIALAAKVSHRGVTGFLRNWLYGETTPRMPGHPDWTADPVVEQPAAVRALRPGNARERARP